MGHDVDRPRIGPILVAGILVTAAADAGVGEEDIDRPVVPLGFGDEMADVGLLGDVAGHRDALDVLGDGFQAAGIAVRHDHALGAFLGVAPRNRLTDAARRAGDDADLAADFHPHDSSINSTYCALVGWRGVDWWQ
jgi:hypothetical protein